MKNNNIDNMQLKLNKLKLLYWIIITTILMVFSYYIVFFADSKIKEEAFLTLLRTDFPLWIMYSACIVMPLEFIYLLKLIMSRKNIFKIENDVINYKFPFLKVLNVKKKDIKDIYINNNNILVIILKKDLEKSLINKLFSIIEKYHNNYIEKNIIKINLNFFKNVNNIDILKFHPSYDVAMIIVNNQKLDEKNKIIELYELKRLSQKEIALLLNLNVSKVNKTIKKYINER